MRSAVTRRPDTSNSSSVTSPSRGSVNAIRRLLTDAALRERLAAAGPASAAPWSWDKLARTILAQLEGA